MTLLEKANFHRKVAKIAKKTKNFPRAKKSDFLQKWDFWVDPPRSIEKKLTSFATFATFATLR